MTKPRMPTAADADKLLSFLGRLYAPGFAPTLEWRGGDRGDGKPMQFPYPAYDPLVEAFIAEASRECWSDRDYEPAQAGKRLAYEAHVQAASLEELRTLLTFVVRGERFCDGHWETMIEGGHVRRILERLQQLAAKP